MKAAQIAFTEALNNIIGYNIDRNPGPMLVIQPTVEMAASWSKDRFAPMLRDTTCIAGKIAASKARNGANTVRHKTGPGWRLTIAGANSPAGLRSRSVRDLFCDEVDGYPASAGSEGDPINLARKRQVTFWNRKFFAGSTPTIKGRSRIETGFQSTDMRYLFLPCPHCTQANGGALDGYQRLEWAHLKWEEGKPHTAAYACVHCGTLIEHHHKQWMLTHYQWRATKPFDGRAGFHINEIYSPFVSWAEMAANFLEAKKLPETLQTFVNTSLAETWEDAGETIEPEGLVARKEPYGPDELPAGVFLLTAGVDVQDDRIEIQLLGWGAYDECWILEQHVIHGDPGDMRLWTAEVDEYLKRRFTTEDGRRFFIEAAGVDSGGHHTQTVYEYCVKRRRYRIWAIKGAGGPGKLAWPKHASRVATSRVQLHVIGVDTIKATLYGRLEKVTKPGPGYIHLPNSFDDELCRQLTSETKKRAYVHGRPVDVWMPRVANIRQEAQDCWNYGYAAYIGRRGPLVVQRRVARLLRLQPRPAPSSQAQAAAAALIADTQESQESMNEPARPTTPAIPLPANEAAKRRMAPMRRPGFVRGWRP